MEILGKAGTANGKPSILAEARLHNDTRRKGERVAQGDGVSFIECLGGNHLGIARPAFGGGLRLRDRVTARVRNDDFIWPVRRVDSLRRRNMNKDGQRLSCKEKQVFHFGL
jgi:hypothetical protein